VSKHKKRGALKLVEAVTAPSIKLDLGCGQNPKDGFEGVDIRGGKAKHVVDLFKFPWGFADNSVDEIHCSHFMEHIPAREIEERDVARTCKMCGQLESSRDLMCPKDTETQTHSWPEFADYDVSQRFVGQDMLFAFMDECYRILKNDCWMHVVVPSARSNRGFQDPTHRRFFMQETFIYFNADWRKSQGLDHYRVSCDFFMDIGHSMPQEEGLRSPEALAQRVNTMWNVTVDWIAKLRKLPRPVSK
jgi:hypothetical protein